MKGDQPDLPLARPAPSFMVGQVPVYGDAVLAPMAGYSDVPTRAVCRWYGSAMQYTEFVPVEALLGRRSRNRYWMRLDKKPGEFPMVFQLFGNEAHQFLRAALNVLPLEPDIIDINMGCSTRRVSGRGAGAGMMRQPALVAATFQLLTRELPVPVTGKIRLGWDADERNFLEIGRIMEDNGAALIAVHGRTRRQKYGGRADWDAIAALKQAVGVPVVGNGDVRTAADIDRMRAHTGCDAVMIGRATIGQPWLLARRDTATVDLAEVIRVVRLHLREMVAYYGSVAANTRFRKHLKQYLLPWPAAAGVLPHMLRAPAPNAVLRLLARLENQAAAAPVPA